MKNINKLQKNKKPKIKFKKFLKQKFKKIQENGKSRNKQIEKVKNIKNEN